MQTYLTQELALGVKKKVLVTVEPVKHNARTVLVKTPNGKIIKRKNRDIQYESKYDEQPTGS